jgi:hypothetical protein
MSIRACLVDATTLFDLFVVWGGAQRTNTTLKIALRTDIELAIDHFGTTDTKKLSSHLAEKTPGCSITLQSLAQTSSWLPQTIHLS